VLSPGPSRGDCPTNTRPSDENEPGGTELVNEVAMTTRRDETPKTAGIQKIEKKKIVERDIAGKRSNCQNALN